MADEGVHRGLDEVLAPPAPHARARARVALVQGAVLQGPQGPRVGAGAEGAGVEVAVVVVVVARQLLLLACCWGVLGGPAAEGVGEEVGGLTVRGVVYIYMGG